MQKTFWAIELTLFRIEADVDEYDVALRGGSETRREEIECYYNGALGTYAAARAVMQGAQAVIRDARKKSASQKSETPIPQP